MKRQVWVLFFPQGETKQDGKMVDNSVLARGILDALKRKDNLDLLLAIPINWRLEKFEQDVTE